VKIKVFGVLMALVLALSLCLVVAAPAVAAGTTWYVTTGGNDTTGDGSSGNPYATITKAQSMAVDGDTIDVAAGSYTESIVVTKRLTIQGKGSGSNPAVDTIIVPTDTSKATIRLQAKGTSATDRLVIKDMLLTDGFAGIYFQANSGDYTTLDNVACVNNSHVGIQTDIGGSTVHPDLVLHNCNLSSNGGHGFYGNTSGIFDGIQFINCHMDNNAGLGLYLVGRVTGLYVSGGSYNNNDADHNDATTCGIYTADLNTGFASPKANVIENAAINGNPRGTYLWTSGGPSFVIDGVTVNNNTATAGITVLVKSGTLDDLQVINSTANGNAQWGIYTLTTAGIIGNVTIDNIHVEENGYWGVYIRGYSGSAPVLGGSVSNSQIINNNTGVYLNGNVTGVSITNNDISNNGGPTGIDVTEGAAAGNEAHHNNIVGNGVGVNNADTDDDFNATCNWWGNASGPTHASNPGGTGDAVSDGVIFAPWLIGEAPDGQCLGGTPMGYKLDAKAELENISNGKKVEDKVDKAIEHLDKSLDPTLWDGDSHLDAKHGDKVFNEEKNIVKDLLKLEKDKKTDPDIVTELEAVIVKLLTADKMLAQTAIDENTSLDGKEIDKANEEMDKAQEELDKGNPDKAIDHYKNAWKHAQKAG
jgi:hypothetical protein